MLIFAVSGHCFGLDCEGGGNPEYLVSDRGTHDPVANVFLENGFSVGVLEYTDNFYSYEDASTGELVEVGFLDLLADLAFVRDEWIGSYDNPTRVIVLAHSHGTVWSHMALLVHEWEERPVPVDLLIDLDGNSLSWESDTTTFFVGDNWGRVIRDYNAETGTTWPFPIDSPTNLWSIEGVAEPQDTEELVPDSAVINLEVFSNGTPYDTDPNYRRDGSWDEIYRLGPTSDHNGVTYPGSEAMNWVAEQVRAAYGL